MHPETPSFCPPSSIMESPRMLSDTGKVAHLHKIASTLKFLLHLFAKIYAPKFFNLLDPPPASWGQLLAQLGNAVVGRSQRESQTAQLKEARQLEETRAQLHSQARKREFLEEYNEEYGYFDGPISIDELRTTEFPRLDGTVYLDHAGATLYANSQIQATMSDFSASLYGNPHSQSDSSNRSSNVVAHARQEVLKFFNAPAGEYSCVFTSGATGALKLVGETFPWSSMSNYFYTMENHNSVLGIREFALAEGATATAVDIEQLANVPNLNAYSTSGSTLLDIVKLRASQRRSARAFVEDKRNASVYNLFAFPSECNFSGQKFDLELVKWIQDGRHMADSRGRWMVLIDAAKGCGTSPPDLSKYPIDFMTVSFYKIFGYPTGLGALILRNDAAKELKKRYFGGGSVAVSVADIDFIQKRESIEQWLEDGTVSFLGISALRYGFVVVNRFGMSAIGKHVGSLTRFTASKLLALKHGNGRDACVLYGKHAMIVGNKLSYWGQDCQQGPVLAFNLKRSDGSWIGYREVEKLAAISGIHLRTGCFCNPGACSKQLGLSQVDFQSNFEAGHICWDDHDIIAGKPTGAVRVSFGYMSSIEDSLALIDFLCKFFVDQHSHLGDTGLRRQDTWASCGTMAEDKLSYVGETMPMHLESIMVYPIKSCAGFNIDVWPLGDCGLLYDREWLVMSAAGDTLTQKKYPMMCLIGTHIDLSSEKLLVTSPNMGKRLEISLKDIPPGQLNWGVQLCGKRSRGQLYGKEIAEWFTNALGTPCSLVRREPRSRQVRSRIRCNQQTCFEEESRELSFANEGQFLLVSRASVEDLNGRLASGQGIQKAKLQEGKNPSQRSGSNFQVDAMRFRPNLVISGALPYEEDDWQRVFIGSEKFTVLGGCNRCQMVNIDQVTARFQDRNDPLLTLASYRRFKGKICFGILLAHEPLQGNLDANDKDWISTHSHQRLLKVGCPVYSEKIMDC